MTFRSFKHEKGLYGVCYVNLRVGVNVATEA